METKKNKNSANVTGWLQLLKLFLLSRLLLFLFTSYNRWIGSVVFDILDEVNYFATTLIKNEQ